MVPLQFKQLTGFKILMASVGLAGLILTAWLLLKCRALQKRRQAAGAGAGLGAGAAGDDGVLKFSDDDDYTEDVDMLMG